VSLSLTHADGAAVAALGDVRALFEATTAHRMLDSVVREPHVSDLARLLQGELESPE
jgi:hypothetical protein